MADEFIPGEKIASFQRWQLTAFDAPTTGEPATAPAPASPQPRPTAAPGAARPAATKPAAPPPVSEPPPPPPPIPEAELAALREAARQEGFEQGYAEGRQKGEAEGQAEGIRNGQKALNDQAQQVAAIVASLNQTVGEMKTTMPAQLLDLAVDIANQLVLGSLRFRKDTLLPLIREAIETLPLHHGHITLLVHPEDGAQLRELIGEQLAQQGTQLVDDKTLSRGGCLLRAGASEVDATIETRWRRVIETIQHDPRPWSPATPAHDSDA